MSGRKGHLALSWASRASAPRTRDAAPRAHHLSHINGSGPSARARDGAAGRGQGERVSTTLSPHAVIMRCGIVRMEKVYLYVVMMW